MCKLIKWFIVIVVLLVVLYGLVDAKYQKTVYKDTVAGAVVGLVHGVVAVFCIMEGARHGHKLTCRRAARIFLHHLRVDMVIGLLIGVMSVLWCMLFQ
jgi:Ca2+/H+ antiporter